MAGVNPIVVIQMLQQYYGSPENKTPRTFTFNRNNRMIVHRETVRELMKRKSFLDREKISLVEDNLKDLLKKTLKGRVGKVWIDPEMKKMAVPLQMSTGSTGYGILPTGSRMKIPEGEFIRAFTYWEKVNDIDLSCFGIDNDGNQKEFSWRNMAWKQSNAITYSGDQTSGYNGGSEYFDIDLDQVKKIYPSFKYIIFCDNVYSKKDFSECECFAGFMVRKDSTGCGEIWKGEREVGTRYSPLIFDPKTVATSFRITADSTFAYLFAIDIENREMIWLNISRSDRTHVAGSTKMDFLMKYFTLTDVISVADVYEWAGTPVQDIKDADIILTNHEVPGPLRDDQKMISIWSYEEILKILV